MKIDTILFFPTSVMFIDDSETFLANFSLLLDEDILYETKSSASEALKAIHARHQPYVVDSYMGKQFTAQKFILKSIEANGFKFSAIAQEAFNPLRFKQLSVIVVDYAMPAMTGLELIQKMENAHIKRILLSGQADTSIIETALQKKLVDLYIGKQTIDIQTVANQGIKFLQHQYFEDTSQRILPLLKHNHQDYLSETQDLMPPNYIEDTLSHHNIVEYYLNDENGSFLLVSTSGEMSLLQCYDEHDIQKILNLAEKLNVTSSIMNKILAREKLPLVCSNGALAISKKQRLEDCFYDVIKSQNLIEKYYIHVPYGMLRDLFQFEAVFSVKSYMNHYY